MKVIKSFNPEGGYKYLLLYGDLVNPLIWIDRIFSAQTFILLFGLLLPFLFLPILRPRYLFLALPTFFQIVLLKFGAFGVIFSTHYQTFLIVPVFLALIDTAVFYSVKQKKVVIVLIVVLGAQFFVSAFFGPLSFLTASNVYLKNLEDKKSNQALLSTIPPAASLSSPHRLLPHLSNRETVYANKLAFFGKKHLSTENFILPEETDYILIDSAEAFEYYFYSIRNTNLFEQYLEGASRMRNTIEHLRMTPEFKSDSLILFSKNSTGASAPWNVIESDVTLPTGSILQSKKIGKIEFLGYFWDKESATIKLFFKPHEKIADDYFIRLTTIGEGGQSWSKLYPPAYGLFPTHDWPKDKIVVLKQPLPIVANSRDLKFELVQLNGHVETGLLNDTRLVVEQEKILGQAELGLE
jgi:hypothetical protein